MTGSVERNRRTFKFAGAVAVFICLALPAAVRAEDPSVLIRRLTSDYGLSIDQLSDYLALGTPADNGERRLVRWDQDEIALGIVASSGVTADMIDKTVAPIESTFRDVGRRLRICIRHWD